MQFGKEMHLTYLVIGACKEVSLITEFDNLYYTWGLFNRKHSVLICAVPGAAKNYPFVKTAEIDIPTFLNAEY